jgi:AcrR family transcriptional regulator
MESLGTAGLTLRGIARELDVTAPAIYNYYPSLAELITALIVDAFVACAEALESAESCAESYGARVAAVMRVYRVWSLDNRTDFELIYGNPIPGYSAPPEITVPAATRAAAPFTRPIGEAMLFGALHPPPVESAAIRAKLTALVEMLQLPIPPEALFYGTMAWSRAHGAIMLELHGHLLPVVGDGAAYLESEIARTLEDIGLTA